MVRNNGMNSLTVSQKINKNLQYLRSVQKVTAFGVVTEDKAASVETRHLGMRATGSRPMGALQASTADGGGKMGASPQSR